MTTDPHAHSPEGEAFNPLYQRGAFPDGLTFEALERNPLLVLPSGLPALSTFIWNDLLTVEGLKRLYYRGAPLHAVDQQHGMPLFYAVREKRHEIFDLLMDCGGAERVNFLQTVRPDKKSLLHIAVDKDDFYMVNRLLDAGADVNAIDAEGLSPVAMAVKNRSVKMIRLLRRRAADTGKYEEASGKKLLSMVFPTIVPALTAESEAELVETLLQANASPDGEQTSQPLVAHYAEKKFTSLVRAFVRAGADVNAHGKSHNHLTALCHAVINRDFDMARALVEEGHADTNLTTPTNDLPLMYALKNGDFVMAEMLIANGADINMHRTSGVTILCQAMTIGLPVTTVEWILQKKADPNLASYAGDQFSRPLHVTANVQKMEYTDILLRYGANPMLRDAQGKLPVEYAETRAGMAHAVTQRLRLATQAAACGRDTTRFETFTTTSTAPKSGTGGIILPPEVKP